MSEIAAIERFGDAVAVRLDDGTTITYSELADRADALAGSLPRRGLGVIRCHLGPATLVAYVAALRHSHPVVLADGSADDRTLRGLVDAFRAEWVIDGDGSLWSTAHRDGPPVDQRAAVLLPTSGTTGSPKHVVLSAANLDANAASIAEFLEIDADERPITSLPFHYSYGLSVVNSHLLRGATLLVTTEPVTARCFWDRARSDGATSLSGVPTHYQVLLRLGLDRLWVPSLRTLTQAGGALATDDVRRVATIAAEHGARFFVMYGQTEATARMAYLPPERIEDHAGSVGRAIPGGSLRLVDEDGVTIEGAGREGELVFRGPNVMQGYAEERADLVELSPPPELRTGDLAVRGESGLYRITGRLKRIVKVRGHRIGLDELERLLREDGHDTVCGGTDDHLVIGHRLGDDIDAAVRIVVERCRIPSTVVSVVPLAEWPTTSSGKIDYRELLELA